MFITFITCIATWYSSAATSLQNDNIEKRTPKIPRKKKYHECDTFDKRKRLVKSRGRNIRISLRVPGMCRYKLHFRLKTFILRYYRKTLSLLPDIACFWYLSYYFSCYWYLALTTQINMFWEQNAVSQNKFQSVKSARNSCALVPADKIIEVIVFPYPKIIVLVCR
jgi:hypothetical protein